MANEIIKLKDEDVREALRLIREIRKAHAQLHIAEEQAKIFEDQIAAIYGATDGYILKDWTIGFEPVEGANG